MNTITIDENIPASQFICRAHRLSDGVLVGEVITTQPTVDVPSLSSAPLYIVVIPYQGERFKPNHTYAVGDLVFPLDTLTTPFYYRREIAGVSSNAEPVWSTISGSLCDDNGVSGAWLCFDLSNPAISAPITLNTLSWNGGVVWDNGSTIWDAKISNWTNS